jgi:hypothetical protein
MERSRETKELGRRVMMGAGAVGSAPDFLSQPVPFFFDQPCYVDLEALSHLGGDDYAPRLVNGPCHGRSVLLFLPSTRHSGGAAW